MEKLLEKKIKITVVSTTWKLIKRPKAEHQNSGHISVSLWELDKIAPNDKLKLEVFSTDNKKKVSITLTHSEILKRLVYVSGQNYKLLRYT